VKNRVGSAVLSVLLACVVSYDSAAQNYPTRAIRGVVTAAPGGGNDFVARVLAQKLSDSLGQSVVIDNRGGSGGLIGTALVADAIPDGHTLLFCFVNFSIYPALYRNLPFDPVTSFRPISTLAATPLVLVVTPKVTAKSVTELIALARSKPDQLNFASTGVGSLGHLAGELFRSMTGASMTHISYKGGGPAIVAVLAGESQVYFSTIPAALGHLKSGRLHALGVTGTRRSPTDPQIPTIAEAGVTGYDVSGWFGLLAPARTPESTIVLLNREVNRTLQRMDVRERLATEGLETLGSTPREFAVLIKQEIQKWSHVVRTAGIRAE
jgi:tripartite-type tricarboxylate transporter receptor subunit TctC